jgi:hypothetical protein
MGGNKKAARRSYAVPVGRAMRRYFLVVGEVWGSLDIRPSRLIYLAEALGARNATAAG